MYSLCECGNFDEIENLYNVIHTKHI
ncbi:hypothetical protein GH893_22400 [Bacillus thuringiensis]|nr:hypothetical protein [Bacillus thuringiensis]